MTRKAVVDSIIDEGQITSRKLAEQAVDQVIGAIARTAVGDTLVTLNGFGTFREKFREGRVARNPRTGEPVTVAGRRVLTFKASKGA